MAGGDVAEFRERMNDALKDALRARDSNSIAAFRSALGAIANAEAVEPGTDRALKPKLGIGVGDVERRSLSLSELIEIVNGEVEEHMQGAGEYENLGRTDAANALRAQAAALVRFLRGD